MILEIESLLISVLGACDVRRDERLFFCPFCHHRKKKLSVNIEKGKWKCWTCDVRGNTFTSLVRKLNVPPDQYGELKRLLIEELPRYKEDTEGQSVKLTLPSEYIPLYDTIKTKKGKDAMRYLEKRGIGIFDVIRYQIGYCEEGNYKNRVIVPSYDESGALNFFVSRAFYDVMSWAYLIPPVTRNVVGFDYYINWKQPIIICEGVFDAMTIKRNAIPLFGKTLSKKLREKMIVEGVNEIYLVLDTDALRETIKMAEHFMKNGVKVYVVELTGKDPSELGFVKTHELIKKSTPLTFPDLMKLKLQLVK